MRHIGRDEVDAGLFQSEKEMGIAGQAIELGDHELGTEQTAGLKRFRQFWTIGRG